MNIFSIFDCAIALIILIGFAFRLLLPIFKYYPQFLVNGFAKRRLPWNFRFAGICFGRYGFGIVIQEPIEEITQ